MSIQTLSVAPGGNTDALFRVWGSAVSTALAAAGLVQTADTGQINWTTVLKATTSNTIQGYEIWRFDDALQATRPVFIKLQYGAGLGSAAHNPGMWMTVGTATDGAGVLSANPTFPGSFSGGAGSAAGYPLFQQNSSVDWWTSTANNFYVASEDAGSLLLAGWFNPTGSSQPTYAGGLLLVERTRDLDGTPNGDGVFFITKCHNAGISGGTTSLTVIYGRAPNFYGVNTSGVPVVSGRNQGQTTGIITGNMSVFPVFTGFRPELCGPSKHVIALHSGDQAVNSQFDASLYGSTATFRALGTSSSGWAHEGGTSAITGAFRVA